MKWTLALGLLAAALNCQGETTASSTTKSSASAVTKTTKVKASNIDTAVTNQAATSKAVPSINKSARGKRSKSLTDNSLTNSALTNSSQTKSSLTQLASSTTPTVLPIAATTQELAEPNSPKTIKISRSPAQLRIDPEILNGYNALQQNQWVQARAAYAQVLSRQPTNFDALLGISFAHQALGETALAQRSLRHLLEHYPRNGDALSALILINAVSTSNEEAELAESIERSQQSAALHYALGVLQFDQLRLGAALNSFARAFALESEQADYAYNLALTLDRLNRIDAAIEQYTVALALAQKNNALFNQERTLERIRVLKSGAK